MKKFIHIIPISLVLIACNPTTLEFKYIYNNEGPNQAIAETMEGLLEREFNVDIVLIEGVSTGANLDSLSSGAVDMALVENY